MENKSPIDTEFEFIPNNPYSMPVNIEGGGESRLFPGNEEEKNKSFLKGVSSEYYELATTAPAIHGAYEKFINKPNPLDDQAPAGWNANNPEKLTNVRQEYLPYMLDATGPKDQDYRLQRVMFNQEHDDNLANGSTLGKIIGGVASLIDPVSLIPVAGWAKYAKFAPTIMKSAARALPGIATWSVLHNAAQQGDKVNGNVHDMVVDSMIDTAFGSALFAGFGAAGLALDKMEIWNLRKIAKDYIDGIDYKLHVNEEGKVEGIKAVDTTGNLSAAQVSHAQELADSSFHKSGFFKIPYLGDAAVKFMSNNLIGAPLIRMLNSPFNAVRGFIDRVADHSIITKKLEEGGTSNIKFSTLMAQEYSELRAMDAQMRALHLERNGYEIKSRPLNGIANVGLGLYNAALKKLAANKTQIQYADRNTFYSEVEDVVRNEKSSEHAAVNDAAAMVREKLDRVYKDYRIANHLPEDWLPPKTAEGYLMRVYDTDYLNNHENEWVQVISKAYADADQVIADRMKPIEDMAKAIKAAESKREELLKLPNITDELVTQSAREIEALNRRKKGLLNKLQDELRENKDFHLHVEDWQALSAKEAKQLKALIKPIEKIKKEINKQEKVIKQISEGAYFKEEKIKRQRKAENAKSLKSEAEQRKAQIETEKSKLKELQDKLFVEEDKLQEKIQNKEVNPRFYNRIPGSQRYALRNPNERLKFRKTFETHSERESAAKQAYNKILNQTAEDTINQVMAGFGHLAESPVKERSIMIPDQVLYDNNFMAKDLMAKIANYSTYLSRRTHIKTIFGDLSEEGGIEPLLNEFNQEYENFRSPINNALEKIKEDLKKENITDKEKNSLNEKQIRLEKQLAQKKKEFEAGKKDINHIYRKMMGLNKPNKFARGVMAFTAIANLPFVPFTMINDLSNIALKHGMFSFIKDSVYPMLESLGGLLKTKDSEAFRKTAGSINLALQDVTTGYADRNWSMMTNPYVNMGRIVNTMEKLAHKSSNFTLTNYIDNFLQRLAASATQSELMRILHAAHAGTMTAKESLYIRKYGIDPAKWSERMTKAFKEGGGDKTKLGGYKSNFWNWADKEASNEFGDAVFRGVKDTIIQRDIADAPLWADNPLGAIVFGFQGWTMASLTRFVTPAMQEPDARKLVGVAMSLATGAMVDPMRRMARGESPFPENQTDEQFYAAAFQNSGIMSWFSGILSDANVISGNRLLGNLRNDRYKDRTRVGLLGPAWGTFNRMSDIISALGTSEFNKADARKMARMIPFANASWTWWLSKQIIDGLDIPETRAQAHALKGV